MFCRVSSTIQILLLLCLSRVAAVPVKREDLNVKSPVANLPQPACPLLATPEATLTVNNGYSKYKVAFLGSGTFGCAYKLLDLWQDKLGNKIEVVAKTLRKDGGLKFSQRELDALQAMHVVTDADGRQWVFIRCHAGLTVTQTRRWKETFPKGYNTDTSPEGIEKCKNFITSLYFLVARKQRWYTDRYGYESGDPNWLNFLFDEDLTKVNIIDWGFGHKVDWTEADNVSRRWMHLLESDSMLPLVDIFSDRYGQVQGLCRSDERDMGRPFSNPTLGKGREDRWSVA